jgi:hypothetical protein
MIMTKFSMYRTIARLFLLCTAFGLVSCVSRTVEPAYFPKVATSQNHEGITTISWPSREGFNYRLAVKEAGKVIYDKKVYRGTGEDIVLQFRLDPGRPLPDYAVMPEKIEN